MRVGVNTLFLIPGEVGGTETYLRETLRAMAATRPAVSLVLFTNRENDETLRRDLAGRGGVEFVKLDLSATSRFSRIVREQVELPGRVRRAGADVLWSPGYTMPRRSPCPQVVTIPDMQYKSFPEDLTRPALIATDLLVRMAARRSTRIIAISEFTKVEVVRFTRAAEGKVDVTPLAADPAFAEKIPLEEARRRTAGMRKSERPYLLTVANSYPHKNLHTLVAAFGLLGEGIPHDLVIVGKARRGEGTLKRQIGTLPEPGRVVRLPGVTREELIALYRGAGLFVFPTLYEGFGLPVLEAMTAGVPVIASREGSVPEIGGDCVLYAEARDPADIARAVSEALSWEEEERSLRLGRARERAARFSWADTARRTVACLRKACGAGGAVTRGT